MKKNQDQFKIVKIMDEKKISAIIALILFITAALLILIPEIPVIETQKTLN